MELLGLGTQIDKKWQLYFHDNDDVEFRQLPIEDTVLIEKRNKKPFAAFKHYYKLEYDFEGYKKLPPCKLTLGFPRDVILDLFNTLEDKDNFTKDNKAQVIEVNGVKRIIQTGLNLNRKWITDIGANAFYKAKTQKPPSLLMDKFTTICMILAVAEGIGLVLKIIL